MSPQRREIRSAYIEWAKLRSDARYNLAASDVLHFRLSELPVRIEDLEISGSSGYGSVSYTHLDVYKRQPICRIDG